MCAKYLFLVLFLVSSLADAVAASITLRMICTPFLKKIQQDTTGMEEVVVWLLYFGFDAAALKTIDVVLSYMRSIPNWAYMGGADAADIGNGGKWFTALGTGQHPMIKMHYRSGLNQIALAEYYRAHPDDFSLLEIIVGSISGTLQNIAPDGAMSMAFHSHPYVMKNDAYSGDFGLGFFGVSLEASAYFVQHKELGPLCYLCDLSSKSEALRGDGDGDGDGEEGKASPSFTIAPRDSYRQRVYLEPLGVYIQADAGTFETLDFNMDSKTIVVTFAAVVPATATFKMHRLRVDKVSRDGLRPGQSFTVVKAKLVRDAWQFPASETTATITWS